MSGHRAVRRILVVVDSEPDREVIQRYLASDREHHVEVTLAGTIEDAATLARDNAFDLALVDWMLPDGPGAELGTRLEGSGVMIPLVLITDQEHPRQLDDALSQGAVDFLAKSDLSPRMLARVCEHAIVRARLTRERDEARQAELSASRLEHEARSAAERALADQARLTERVSRLHLLSSLFSAAVTTEDVSRALVTHSGVFGRPTSASVYVLRDQHLELQDSFGFEGVEQWARIPLSVSTPLTEAVRRGEVVHVSSHEEMVSKYRIDPEHHDVSQEWVAAPLRTEQDVLGVIGLRFVLDEQPLVEELDFVRLIAELATQAILRAKLYEEASRRADFERRLLAIVGHDLRTPLSAIVVGVALLENKHPGEPVLERLRRSAMRMAELIDDVMRRSEAFGHVAEDETGTSTDLVAAIHDAVQELRAAFPSHGIVVVDEGPVSSRINPRRLSQALGNLVRNAVQYGRPDRPVTITIAYDGDDRISLSVHNEGAAIPPEAIPLLFDPFQRGVNASGRGAGLGLFIVHELVSEMGGRIRVESGSGGTTFTMVLPLFGPAPSRTPPMASS